MTTTTPSAFADEAARVRRLAAAAIAADPGARTVRVPVWGAAPLTVPCPAWCAADHGKDYEQHPEDVRHSADEIELTVPGADGAPVPLVRAELAQSPFSLGADRPYVCLSLGDGDDWDHYDGARLRGLIDGMRAALTGLEALAAQLDAAGAELLLAEDGGQ